MFLKDFISKIEKTGLTVSVKSNNGKNCISIFNDNTENPIIFMNEDDIGYIKIYNDIFNLDKSKYIIDTAIDFFKTPKEERIQDRYCLYYSDLSGYLRVIEKHYSSIISGYLFNESMDNFKDIGELMNYYSIMLNKDKYTLRNVDIKELPDNWKPESFGGNNNSIKYFKVEDDKL